MKVNKYGIKMANLKEISGRTVNNPAGFSQIDYDRISGELFETWHSGSDMTDLTEYNDPYIIHICNTTRHMTMQQIADAVRYALEAPAVVRCRDCVYDGDITCPICFIENKTLQFINHDPYFFCAYGERK